MNPSIKWLSRLEQFKKHRWLSPEEAFCNDLSSASQWAQSLLQEHLTRLSPYNPRLSSPLPVRVTRDAIEVCSWAKIPLREKSSSSRRMEIPAVSESFSSWSQALSQAFVSMSVAVRKHPKPRGSFLDKLRARFQAKKVPSDDPWNTLTSQLSQLLKSLRYADSNSLLGLHTQEGSRSSTRLIGYPLQALTNHLLWYEAFANEASPWEPVLSLWSVGAWPVLCPDASVVLYLPKTKPQKVLPSSSGAPLSADEVGDGWIQYSDALPLGIAPFVGEGPNENWRQLQEHCLGSGLGPLPVRVSFPPMGNPPFR